MFLTEPCFFQTLTISSDPFCISTFFKDELSLTALKTTYSFVHQHHWHNLLLPIEILAPANYILVLYSIPAQNFLPPGSVPWYLLLLHPSKTRSRPLGKCVKKPIRYNSFFLKNNHYAWNLTTFGAAHYLISIPSSLYELQIQAVTVLSTMIFALHDTVPSTQ